MTTDELIEELGTLPSMMTAAEELEVIEKLRRLPDEQLLRDLERIFPLLWNLFDSHTGAAIFEVDSGNLGEFRAFAERLRRLAQSVQSPEDKERLENMAEAFSTQFSM